MEAACLRVVALKDFTTGKIRTERQTSLTERQTSLNGGERGRHECRAGNSAMSHPAGSLTGFRRGTRGLLGVIPVDA